MESNDTPKVKSLHKALNLLNCFTKKPFWGITELSVELGLFKSNVFNILQTMESMGYVERDPVSQKYCLGYGMYELSRALTDRYDFQNIALPYLQQLANECKERVYLATGRGDQVIYLGSYDPVEQRDSHISMMGVFAPKYCTGLGKILLAYESDDTVRSYYSDESKFIRFTDTTITNLDDLFRELEIIRRRGYAIDNMEHEYGVKCVAAPLFNKKYELLGAVSVSGPSLRFGEKQIFALKEKILACCSALERRV
jgi:DNA-binding IclR family transcriptional regulator